MVTVVILSAFIPTLIAQQFFRPHLTGPDPGERADAGAPPATDTFTDELAPRR